MLRTPTTARKLLCVDLAETIADKTIVRHMRYVVLGCSSAVRPFQLEPTMLVWVDEALSPIRLATVNDSLSSRATFFCCCSFNECCEGAPYVVQTDGVNFGGALCLKSSLVIFLCFSDVYLCYFTYVFVIPRVRRCAR